MTDFHPFLTRYLPPILLSWEPWVLEWGDVTLVALAARELTLSLQWLSPVFAQISWTLLDFFISIYKGDLWLQFYFTCIYVCVHT